MGGVVRLWILHKELLSMMDGAVCMDPWRGVNA